MPSEVQCSRGWGARCAQAQSPSCRCNCGGKNHGNQKARRDYERRRLTKSGVFEGEPERRFSSDKIHDIVLWRDGRDACTNVPQRFVYHSPDGFEWGYGGSGPSDLALNILARCVPPSDAWQLHHDFKRDFIAAMPEHGGIITGECIRLWIEQQWSQQELAL